MEKAIEKARVLIEALPYISSFRRKFVVVKLGGSAVTDEPALRSVVKDLVFMEQVGMWPVLVHGGGPRISEEMKRAGVEPAFVEGHRVTPPEVISLVARVLIEDISARVCELVEDEGGKAMPLNGRGSSFLLGRKRRLPSAPEADLGLVGEITSVDREACYRLADGGLIPVVAPIARMEGTGEHASPVTRGHLDFGELGPTELAEVSRAAGGAPLLNVNADSAASAIAAGLAAEKVVFLSNVPGVLRDPPDESTLISSIRRGEVDRLVGEGVISGGMLPKVRSCVEALEGGVRKAHIVSALLPHALLLEMFTDRGIGTEITA